MAPQFKADCNINLAGTVARKDIFLPFPPFTGLYLLLNVGKDIPKVAVKVTSVTWEENSDRSNQGDISLCCELAESNPSEEYEEDNLKTLMSEAAQAEGWFVH